MKIEGIKVRRFREENLSQNILQTLVYADIFDYPLTLSEVWRFLIDGTEVKVEVIQKTLLIFADYGRILRLRSGQVFADKEFYFLKGRGNLVQIRKNRERWSQKKIAIAQVAAKKLSIIPTIKMIGITGALAMNNADEDDDIDFIVVTAENSLWLTRLLIILLSPILGIARRKPGEQNVKDKICFNLFLEENHLKIEPENLFLAHEICQAKPLVNKDETYEKFLWENQWVSGFLPNAKNSSRFNPSTSLGTRVQSSKLGRKHLISQYLSILISFFNRLAFVLQYQYMKPKITSEKVSLHQAFFHPGNLGNKVQEEFERRVKSFEERIRP